jgi:FKBP-type peptidyl-prolyl cis-trans isomerase
MKFMNILKAYAFFAAFLGTALSVNAGDTLTIETFLNSKNIKAEKTREGIFYTIDTEGAGVTPRMGDFIKIKYTGKLLDGKTFDTSPKDEPFVFQLGYRQVIQGWDVLIPKLRVGTKATAYIPAELGYGASGIGDVIPANASLVYDIEVVEVLNADTYDTHMRGLEDKERREFQKKLAEQFEKDKKDINDYAIAHKLKVNRAESGLSYIITKQGKGEKAKEGNILSVHYEGVLLDDKLFDSTNGKQPFSFRLGEGKVIQGWDEGLSHFNKGSEGYLLIPSKLAYGAMPLEDGETIIPAHAVLIFKIQVVDIQ